MFRACSIFFGAVFACFVFADASKCFAQTPRSFLGKNAGQWAASLQSSKPQERRGAAFVLGKLGAHATGAVPRLVHLLQNDPEPSVRDAAAFALGDICKASETARKNPKVLAALRTRLSNDTGPLVRRSCAYALGCLGKETAKALGDLQKASKDSDQAVRQNVAFALGEIGKEGVPCLRDMLKNEKDALVIRDVAGALRRIGYPARIAVPDLTKHCANADLEVRKAVVAALVPLVTIDNRDAMIQLHRALKDPEIEIRRNAAIALGNVGGNDAVTAIPVLLDILNNDSLANRRQAAAVFGNIGPKAAKAAPALYKLLTHPDNQLAIGAVYSLGKIKARGAINGLIAVGKSRRRHWTVRQQCAFSLLELAPFEKPLPIFRELANIAGDTGNHEAVRAYILTPMFKHDAGDLQDSDVLKTTLSNIINGPRKKKNNVHNLMRYNAASLMAIIQGKEADDAVMGTLEEFLNDTNMQTLRGTSGRGTGDSEPGSGKSNVDTVGAGDGRELCVQILNIVGKDRVNAYQGIVNQLISLAGAKNTAPKLRKKCQEIVSKFSLKKKN